MWGNRALRADTKGTARAFGRGWAGGVAAIALSGLLVACAPPSQSPSQPPAPAAGEGPPLALLTIDSRPVRIHMVKPAGPPPWPTVLVLHGASGLGSGYALQATTDALAEWGIASAVVQYFDALSADTTNKGGIRHFARRQFHLGRVISHLLAQPQVLGPRIGVFGYSLGGFHASALAATDGRIAAAVALNAGLSGSVPSHAVSAAAPVMFAHADQDRVVPYKRSEQAHKLWRQHGRETALLPIRGAGHVLRGKARRETARAMATFLAQRIKNAAEMVSAAQ